MAGDFYDIKVMHELVRNLPKAVREQESLLVALRAAWVTFGEAVEEHKEDENGEGGPFPYFATSYKWDADDVSLELVLAAIFPIKISHPSLAEGGVSNSTL